MDGNNRVFPQLPADNKKMNTLYNLFRHRSIVRFFASILPIKAKIRPFSQIYHGIIIHDTDYLKNDKLDKQYSDDFDLNQSISGHSLNRNGHDLESDWESISLFDITSLNQPQSKHMISRTTLCIGNGDDDIESAVFVKESHSNHQQIISPDFTSEKIDHLETEINLLRTQLEKLTSKNNNENYLSNLESPRKSSCEVKSIPHPPSVPKTHIATTLSPYHSGCKGHDLLSEINKVQLKHVDNTDSNATTTKSTSNKQDIKDIGEFLTESLQQKFTTLCNLDNSDQQIETTFSSTDQPNNDSEDRNIIIPDDEY